MKISSPLRSPKSRITGKGLDVKMEQPQNVRPQAIGPSKWLTLRLERAAAKPWVEKSKHTNRFDALLDEQTEEVQRQDREKQDKFIAEHGGPSKVVQRIDYDWHMVGVGDEKSPEDLVEVRLKMVDGTTRIAGTLQRKQGKGAPRQTAIKEGEKLRFAFI